MNLSFYGRTSTSAVPRLGSRLTVSGLAAALVVTSLSITVSPAEVQAAAAASLPKRCTAPKHAIKTPTKFGISLSPTPTLADDRQVEEARFGKIKIVRTYDPTIPPADAWKRRKSQLRGMRVVTSFRMSPQEVLAGKYDRQLRQYFRQTPRRKTVYWTFYHEPEPAIEAGQFSKDQYRRAWRRIAKIAGSFCKPRLFPTLILTGWTADRASGRTWTDFFPGRRFVSVLAWDPYNQAVGTPSTYRPPRDVFRAVVRKTRAAELPFAIAETGTARVPGDSGAGRAEWLRKAARYLRRHDAVFVTYFQSTNMGDFELRDKPSIDAYKPFVQSS